MTVENGATSSPAAREPAGSPRISRPLSLTTLTALAIIALVVGAISYFSSAAAPHGASVSGMAFGAALLGFGGIALVASLLGAAFHAIMQTHLQKTVEALRGRSEGGAE
ncbi:hypothetical protein [Microbacterium gorillae]|uniref:hypothetical protein n=1 Tax=Microbacterium gorillae TaxID=1231063 RepID=UPI003D96EE60